MEKVSLYDPEKDIVVDINLSPEDFLRAQQDMTFATSLLNAALKEKDSKKNVENSIELVPSQQTISTMGQESAQTETNTEMNISNTEDSGSTYRWSTAAVLLLLETYKTFQDKFSNGKYSHKKIWEEISAILVEKGHTMTGPQCAAKLRSLKKAYKSTKEHNNRSGNDRRPWQFYEVMDEMFSKRAWCSPVAVASSTGLSIKQEKAAEFVDIDSTSELSTESEQKMCKRTETSKGKENVCSLLKRRLHQKTEQEEAKAKRHKERLEMDEKFLAVLNKFVEK
ncbi:uncharacterized protein [Temnothorax longispinosus]|uniref:uncharacterized protein n=1 Tax=Temnothorax longispinosus TaxID=300112 RepID=UPI003A9A237E